MGLQPLMLKVAQERPGDLDHQPLIDLSVELKIRCIEALQLRKRFLYPPLLPL